MPAAFVPDRGNVVWIDFHPQAGHEQARRRAAVILSPASYNGLTGLALVCPVTSRVKGYTFEVAIPAGASVSGVILADQVKSLDWLARRSTYIETLPVGVINDVLAKVHALLF